MAARALSPHGSSRIDIRVPASLRDAVDLEASRRGIDRSTLLRIALADHLDWSEPEPAE